MGENAFYGLDLVLRLIGNDVTEKTHVLTAFVHWKLTKEGFKCLGLGDDPTLGPSETGSEYLPEGWASADKIRYVYKGQVYLLIILKSEGLAIYNFSNPASEKATVVHFNIEETVGCLNGPIEELIPSYRDVIDNINNSMIAPHIVGHHQETSTQTPSSSSTSHDTCPLREDRSRPSSGRFSDVPQPAGPYGLGHSDLYPFGIGGGVGGGRTPFDPLGIGGGGSGGGGMLFDPFGRPRRGIPDPGLGVPGGLPRGSVPPGARFDPVGPRTGERQPRRQPPPDADHLPPPGYDDMFM